MKRTASASWTGDLVDGKGSLTSQSGVLSKTPYSFKTRFADGPGTNPEELIAAAHAGCFTMALAAQLAKEGLLAESIHTWAAVTLDKLDGTFLISAVHLDLVAKIPGAESARFEKIAQQAKLECPVSKLLNAKITLAAKLDN